MAIQRTLRRLVLVATALLTAAGIGLAQSPSPVQTPRIALVATIEGAIGPATVHHIEDVMVQVRQRRPEVLVLRLNTPGGLATSMRQVISAILSADVPVVGYVAPSGAHAASAGTYILYATHIAAMAPGTNIGAATPIQIGGGLPGLPSGQERSKKKTADGKTPEESAPSEEDTAKAKAVNDAVAFMRSLAEMHGRNVEWAEKAVRQAATLSAQQALAQNVVNVIADDVPQLLKAIDRRQVKVGGKMRTLATAGLKVEVVEPNFLTRALGFLSNPNVALILLMVGVYGLIFEFANPGTVGPGVIGVTCLVLGLYALNQLPLDYAGLALLLLGVGFMLAEAVTPSFGVFGVGGLAAFIIGAAMLVETDAPAYQLSWWTIAGTAAASGGVLVLLLGYVWRVYHRKATPAVGGVVGGEGTVIDWGEGEGHVWAEGERWHARGDAGLTKGDAVRVREIDGLTLVVTRQQEGG